MSKRMIMLCLGILLLIPNITIANNLIWSEDLDQAKVEAAKNNKYIFVSFSGSDWCHWCIKLDEEVLSTKEFQCYAEDKLVMVLVDFPKRKKQPQELKIKNEELARKYRVRGFPSVALLSPEGKLVSMTGYRRGGAEAYIEHLELLINQ